MLEQEYRSLQRLMKIADLRQKGIQDTHLLDWNFRVAEDTPYIQMGKGFHAECPLHQPYHHPCYVPGH